MYLDLARELIHLWNTKVTVMPIVTDELWTFPKGLVRRFEELEIGALTETIHIVEIC